MKPQRWLRLCLTAGLVVLALIGYGQGLRDRHRSVPPASSPPEVVLSPGATVVKRSAHLKCGCVDEEHEPSGALAGLDLEGIRRMNPGWTVVSFDQSRVELFRAEDTYCTFLLAHRFIGIHQGNVAVFYGEPGGHEAVKSMTDIPVSSLDAADQSRLGVGVVVTDDDEVLRWLEGLAD